MGSLEELISDLDQLSIIPVVPKRRLWVANRFSRFKEKVNKMVASRGYSSVTLRLHKRVLDSPIYGEQKPKTGNDILADIISNFKCFYKPDGAMFCLRADQQKMVAHMIAACLPRIFKTTLDSNKDRIMKMLGINEINEQLLCITARRVGKTTCVAFFCAIMLIVMPTLEISVFSTGARAALNVMKMIETFLHMNERGRALLSKEHIKNNSEMVLYGTSKLEKKILHAYPDSPDVRFLFIF